MLSKFKNLSTGKKVIVIIIAIPALLYGVLFGVGLYEDYQLKKVADSIEVPESWELASSTYRGEHGCLDVCRYIRKEFIVPVNNNYDDLIEEFVNSNELDWSNTKCGDEGASYESSGVLCIVEGTKNGRVVGLTLFEEKSGGVMAGLNVRE